MPDDTLEVRTPDRRSTRRGGRMKLTVHVIVHPEDDAHGRFKIMA